MIPQTLQVSQHKDYKSNLFIWGRTRDCVAGEARVKSKKTLYLPMPSAMQDTTPATSSQASFIFDDMTKQAAENPNAHFIAAYAAYMSRAEFPEITQFILRGLLGLTNAEMPTIVLPPRLQHLIDKATPTGLSFADLYMYAISEVLVTGRLPIILDLSSTGEVIFVPVVAESLENWKTSGGLSSDRTGLAAAIIRDFDFKAEDIFGSSPTEVRKLVTLNEKGQFSISKYVEDQLTSTTIPIYQSKALSYIPMVCIGSITNSFNVDPSPLSPIAASAIQIYMKNADLSNAEFLTCNPTLVLSGVDSRNKPSAIGSSICWVFPDPDAKALYTHTDTSALTHMLNHINVIYDQAIYQGAQLLDSSKKASESAETTRLKQAASGATLLNVVNNVKEGFLNLLKMACEWTASDYNEVKFMPLTEFMSPTLSAADQKALVESWIARAISHDTLLDNFRKAGILVSGETIEAEKTKIDAEDAETEKKLVRRQNALGAGHDKSLPNTPDESRDTAGSSDEPKTTDAD